MALDLADQREPRPRSPTSNSASVGIASRAAVEPHRLQLGGAARADRPRAPAVSRSSVASWNTKASPSRGELHVAFDRETARDRRRARRRACFRSGPRLRRASRDGRSGGRSARRARLGSILDLEHRLDFADRVQRQIGDADGGAGVAAAFARKPRRSGRRRRSSPAPALETAVDGEEAAEPDDARDPVEIAECGLQPARAR